MFSCQVCLLYKDFGSLSKIKSGVGTEYQGLPSDSVLCWLEEAACLWGHLQFITLWGQRQECLCLSPSFPPGQSNQTQVLDLSKFNENVGAWRWKELSSVWTQSSMSSLSLYWVSPVGGRPSNWVSTGRVIYSFYSVNEADFVSSGDHIQRHVWKQTCYTWQAEGSRTKKAKGHLWPEHIWGLSWGLATKKYWTGEQSSTGAFLPTAQMFLPSQLHRASPTYNAHKFPTAQQLLSMFIKTFKITVCLCIGLYYNQNLTIQVFQYPWQLVQATVFHLHDKLAYQWNSSAGRNACCARLTTRVQIHRGRNQHSKVLSPVHTTTHSCSSAYVVYGRQTDTSHTHKHSG